MYSSRHEIDLSRHILPAMSALSDYTVWVIPGRHHVMPGNDLGVSAPLSPRGHVSCYGGRLANNVTALIRGDVPDTKSSQPGTEWPISPHKHNLPLFDKYMTYYMICWEDRWHVYLYGGTMLWVTVLQGRGFFIHFCLDVHMRGEALICIYMAPVGRQGGVYITHPCHRVIKDKRGGMLYPSHSPWHPYHRDIHTYTRKGHYQTLTAA